MLFVLNSPRVTKPIDTDKDANDWDALGANVMNELVQLALGEQNEERFRDKCDEVFLICSFPTLMCSDVLKGAGRMQ